MLERLKRIYQLLTAVNGWQLLSGVAAVAALISSVYLRSGWLVAALAIVALVLSALSAQRPGAYTHRLGYDTAARILVACVVAVPPFGVILNMFFAAAPTGPIAASFVWSTSPVLVPYLALLAVPLAMCTESISRALIAYAKPVAANLAGATFAPRQSISGNGIYWVNTVGLALLLLLTPIHSLMPRGGLDVPLLALIAAVVIAIGMLMFNLLMLLEQIRNMRMYRRANSRLYPAVEQYAPKFAFYWDAPAHTEFQAKMWLPYLERVGIPFMVILRRQHDLQELGEFTSAPVIYCRALGDLDGLVAPSLKVACYVNSASRNTHMLRFTQLRHIQMNHGDSDKAPSVNPNFRAYDRDFVAGQAAIDRFKLADVRVHEDLFRIVGRPQVEDIVPSHQAISEVTRPSVLYAPTWAGANEDSHYCSLPVAKPIIAELLKRGYRVLFRPHGYTFKSPELKAIAAEIDQMLAADEAANGREHVYGERMDQMTFVDAVNASDAMIADVSSVVSDYLFSNKPLAMVAVSAPAAEFVADFPVARCAYVLDSDHKNLTAQLDDMLGVDSKSPVRRELKTYYLGSFADTDSPEAYAGRFVAALSDEIATA